MEAVAVSTAEADSASAGRALGQQIQSGLGTTAHAVIVFAAPNYDHQVLLQALQEACSPELIVGASSAGEFTNDTLGVGLVSALAINDPEACFSLCVGKDLKADPAAAARNIAKCFKGQSDHHFPHRSALVLTDALAGYADVLADELTLATAGEYQFFGGGAGDNASFERTTVFSNTEVLTDAAVALEILSHQAYWNRRQPWLGTGFGAVPRHRSERSDIGQPERPSRSRGIPGTCSSKRREARPSGAYSVLSSEHSRDRHRQRLSASCAACD